MGLCVRYFKYYSPFWIGDFKYMWMHKCCFLLQFNLVLLRGIRGMHREKKVFSKHPMSIEVSQHEQDMAAFLKRERDVYLGLKVLLPHMFLMMFPIYCQHWFFMCSSISSHMNCQMFLMLCP